MLRFMIMWVVVATAVAMFGGCATIEPDAQTHVRADHLRAGSATAGVAVEVEPVRLGPGHGRGDAALLGGILAVAAADALGANSLIKVGAAIVGANAGAAATQAPVANGQRIIVAVPQMRGGREVVVHHVVVQTGLGIQAGSPVWVQGMGRDMRVTARTQR